MRDLRIEQLAAEAGTSVSTIRYYQTNGLLTKPKQKGRVALYSSQHLSRLKEIRRLSKMGFSLRQMGQMGSLVNDKTQDPILSKLIVSTPLTLKALISKSGMPIEIVKLAIGMGLIKTVPGTANLYYPDSIEMLTAAGQLIEAGISPEELLELAQNHSVSIEKTASQAVKIFVKSIQERKAQSGDDTKLSRKELSEEIQNLMTQTVSLVSAHFRQALFAQAANFLKTHPTSTKSPKSKTPNKTQKAKK